MRVHTTFLLTNALPPFHLGTRFVALVLRLGLGFGFRLRFRFGLVRVR